MLITNLVIYARVKKILIIVIIDAMTSNKDVSSNFHTGYLLIVNGILILLAILPFLYGRFLSISATVNFTKKIPTMLMVNGVLLILNAFVSIFIDSAYFAKSNIKRVGAYFLVILIHATFCAALCFFIYKTILLSKLTASSVLSFHDYLIEFR